jgi:hypothetical protein
MKRPYTGSKDGIAAGETKGLRVFINQMTEMYPALVVITVQLCKPTDARQENFVRACHRSVQSTLVLPTHAKTESWHS